MLSTSRLQSIIWTSRIDEARDFYEGVLGLALKAVSDGALVFDVSGSDLRVSPVPSTQPSQHTVMGFAVPDVDSEVAALGERGVVFERFAGLEHEVNAVVVTPGEARVAWFRDPDGNILSVVQFR